MYLSVHALTGAALGQNIASPLWAFLWGFMLHFVMDLIPHGDGKMFLTYQKTGKKKGAVCMIFADVIITFFLISFFSAKDIIDLKISSVSYALIGSLLPDLIVALHELLNLFPRFHRFHTFNHNYLAQKIIVNFIPGTVMQIILAWWLIRTL